MKFAKKLVCILTAAALLGPVFILPSAAALSAAPTQSAVLVGTTAYQFDAYCINGNNYFKLHDIAYALSGTAKQFQATFDGLNKGIGLISDTPYDPNWSAPADSGQAKSITAISAPYDVYLDGVRFTLTAYIIGASSFVRLRDLAAAVGFGVRYASENDTIVIDTTTGYAPDPAIDKAADVPNVTLIGDSIGIGVAPYLKEYYPSLYADAKVSRQFSEAKSILQELLRKGQLGSTVVVELGTNGAFSAAQMRAAIRVIGSDRKIVFVNTQVPRSWCSSVNRTLAAVSAEYANVIIADWYGASLDKSAFFHEDGIHPNSTGAKALAKIIADAIAKS